MFENLKNLKNLGSIMANAKDLQEKFEHLKAQLGRKVVEAEAGAGAVRVKVNGKMEVLDVSLDPAMIGTLAGEGAEADKEMVEELITSAINAAMAKARDLVQAELREAAGGMDIPGLEGMLGQ